MFSRMHTSQVDDCVRAKQFAEADKLQQQVVSRCAMYVCVPFRLTFCCLVQIQRMLDGAPPAPETVASLQQQIRDQVASGRSDKAQETACKACARCLMVVMTPRQYVYCCRV